MNLMRLLRLLTLATTLVAAPAFAFPWMARHYGSCAACHVDPSGAGQLTMYGRAQAENLLRFKTVRPKAGEEPEVPKSANFLWGVELPEWLNLSGNVRAGPYFRPGSTTPVIPLIMATDLYATVNAGDAVFHLTAGPGFKRSELAQVFPVCDPAAQVAADPQNPNAGQCAFQAVSREFWAGYKLADETVMLRLGRMNLPFGLRNNEHIMWVRDLTHTNVNTDQQVGASVAYNTEKLRGELMAILGNYQVAPDDYRQRGYSFFGEYSPVEKTYLGVSSLITYAGADLATLKPTTRHAHGVFARYSPIEPLVLLAEANLLAWQSPGTVDRLGFAALLQGDYEAHPGIHLQASVEAMHQGDGAQFPGYGLWAGATAWPLPHLEVRVDGIYRVLTSPQGASTGDFSVLTQLHVFL